MLTTTLSITEMVFQMWMSFAPNNFVRACVTHIHMLAFLYSKEHQFTAAAPAAQAAYTPA